MRYCSPPVVRVESFIVGGWDPVLRPGTPGLRTDFTTEYKQEGRLISMSILVDSETRVICQGITGKAGAFHTTGCLEYG
ncbi:MAG: hypothetical protein WBE26_16370, partial [Phycisphaerae bacterium]